MRTGFVIAIGTLTIGCYNYAPLATPTPAPGTFIAATLTDSASLAMTSYLGSGVTQVRGRYVGTSDAGIQIAVSSVVVGGGDELPWAREQVTLPPVAVRSIQLRSLATGRSVLLAGVGVAGVAATVAAFSLTGTGSPTVGTWLPPGHK